MQNILNDLSDLFPDTIYVRSVTTDGFGRKTVGAERSYRAQVSGQEQRIRNADGQTIKSSVMAIVAGTGFKTTDVVRLPSRFSPNKPPVVHVEKATDENGAHHETIYF